MKTLVLGHREVTKLLSMKECIKVMREALQTLAKGQAVQPLRHFVKQPDGKGLLALMPAYLANPAALGLKTITVFPGNLGTPYESHQGAVLLFETKNGSLLSILDASSITAIRTAAVSAVATELLAKNNVSTLGILGSGRQASTHLEAMLTVKSAIRKIRVWSRNPDHAEEFAKRESTRHGLQIEVVDGPESAVSGSEIVCTTTSATFPILKGAWLSPGTHVNAVGGGPGVRELDSEAIVRSRLFTDRRESIQNEADDFKIPKQEGVITDSDICGEIGEILIGKVQGRRSENEITIFRSLGLAVEDLAAAHYLHHQALSKGLGTSVDFNEQRQK